MLIDVNSPDLHVVLHTSALSCNSVVLVAGCKSACNRHGTCALEDGEYHCVCSDGWAGLDCSIRLEMECNDEIDNDEGENQSD